MTKKTYERVFNHDGYGILADLASTPMREQDAADLLVKPLAEAGLTTIDWCTVTTGAHNCRTRHQRLYTHRILDGFIAEGQGRVDQIPLRRAICTVIEHYAAQPLDLLDIVVKYSHDYGLKVFGCQRLNHANATVMMEGVPGRGFGRGGGARKDFRDESFHRYLLEIYEDLLEKGVDGLTLDFERKAPFFPPDTPQNERFDACRAFVRKVRQLTDKPIAARVSHDATSGEPQGQDPEGWLREDLLDAVIPATHNHEPDRMDWDADRFIQAAKASPRPCAVWPQIWPTPVAWREHLKVRNEPDQVVERARDLFRAGANGAYYFNFCCYWPRLGRPSEFPGGRPGEYEAMFTETARVARQHCGATRNG